MIRRPAPRGLALVAPLALLLHAAPMRAQDAPTPPAQVRAPDGQEYPLYPAPLAGPVTFASPFSSEDGREILVGRAGDGRWYLMDLTRTEDGALQDGRRRVFGAGRQRTVGCEDFPTLARTGLHAEEELAATTAITGRTLEQIHQMGRPEGISTAGFLARDEELLPVLAADNRTVAALRLTHPELARPLFHLWNLVRAEVDRWPMPTKDQRICVLRYLGQEVTVRTSSSRGIQTSLFEDEIVGNSEFWIGRELPDADRAFLREHYPHLSEAARESMERRLTHLHTGEMVAFYIARYGFYEGHTDYRAEPLALAWIFGLRTLPQIEKALPGGLERLLVEDGRD